MTNTYKHQTCLIFKNIIRVIIFDYNLSIPIINENTLHQYLTDIIIRATTNCNLFSKNRLNILLLYI